MGTFLKYFIKNYIKYLVILLKQGLIAVLLVWEKTVLFSPKANKNLLVKYLLEHIFSL